MSKTPCLPIIHSAAIIAPSANPSLLFAVCFISILSSNDEYVMLCCPMTLSILSDLIGVSLFDISFMSLAKVLAVPLGLSNFSV